MRSVHRARSHVRAGLLAALWTGLAGGASADVLIVSSDAPALKPGQQVGDADRIEVPAGAKVRVLLPSGKTQLISGPASGTVKDIAKGGPMVEGVWAKAKDLLATGGADASRPGAVRGAPAGGGLLEGGRADFAWNVVPTAVSGSVCVERGARLALARAGADKAATAMLIDTSANARSAVSWPAQSALADWPAELAPRHDAVYQLTAGSARPVMITLRLLDRAQTQDDSALAALLEGGCRAQARAWLAR